MQHTTNTRYLDSKPKKVSTAIFQLYQFVFVEAKSELPNTGIMVEDGCLEFMFVKEKNVHIQIQEAEPIPLPPSFSLHKVALPYRFIFPDTLTLFTIKIQPWVSSFFFSTPKQQVVDLKTLHGEKFESLRQTLFAAASFEQMIDIAETFFSKETMPDLADYDMSKKICESIYSSNGNISIKNLMEQFPAYRQKINQLFLEQTFCSIKEFAIYTRVRAALQYRVSHPEESLTTISQELGYFDQSHFIKDIKKTTGVTPSHFFSTFNLYREQLK